VGIKVNANYANIFIKSAVHVFQKEAGIILSRMGLEAKKNPKPYRPIAIVIGVTGFLNGQIVYAMDTDLANSITRAMLPNYLNGHREILVNSSISEIVNIITGQASIALAGSMEKLHITPPVVIMGPDIVFDFVNIPTIALNLLSEVGILEINIALAENVGE